MVRSNQIEIIIIYPYRFREFDRLRFEVNLLKKRAHVVIYELIDALSPHFSKAYHTQDESKDVKRVSSVFEWRRDYLNKVTSSEHKYYVINYVSSQTFKELFVNYVVSRSNVDIIEYKNPGIPCYLSDMDLFDRFIEKIRYALKRGTFVWLKSFLVSKIVQSLSKILCRKSDFSLVAGDEYMKQKNKKIIPANSFDYTMHLQSLNNDFDNSLYSNKVVFIDSGAPLFDTDSLLMGNTHPLTINKWYPAIRKYFDELEKMTSLEIVIAAHPKHQYDKNTIKIFGDRSIIHGQTQEMILKSKLVLIRNSTAVSYAVLYKKPIIIMYSDELLGDNNSFYKDIKFWSQELSCPFVNIDAPVFPNETDQLYSVNHQAYLQYKKKYLTSRVDNKTNCEVIMDEIVGS